MDNLSEGKWDFSDNTTKKTKKIVVIEEKKETNVEEMNSSKDKIHKLLLDAFNEVETIYDKKKMKEIADLKIHVNTAIADIKRINFN